MASPQKENGYTPIANELMEHIYKTNFTSTEFKIVLLVSRFTYGFSRSEHDFSLTFISNAINISKRYVSTSVLKLIEDKILIVVSEHTMTVSRTIKLNKDYDQWSRTTVPQLNRSSTVDAEFHSGVEPQFNTTVDVEFHTPVDPQFYQDKQYLKQDIKTNIKTIDIKDIGAVAIIKPSNKKPKSPVVYAEIDKIYCPLDSKLNEAVCEFIKFRSGGKHPLTEYGVNSLIRNLNKLSTDADIQIQILDRSIFRGWEGVFALPEDTNNKVKPDYNATVNKMLEEERMRNENRGVLGIN